MNEKVTLQGLIEALAKRHQMEQADADAFVKAFFDLIRRALESDKYIKIRGLGIFKRFDVDAHETVNPRTGERIEIQSYSKVTFTPDAALRDLVNRPFSQFETVVLNENAHFDDLEENMPDDALDEDLADADGLFSEEMEVKPISEETVKDSPVEGAEAVVPVETEEEEKLVQARNPEATVEEDHSSSLAQSADMPDSPNVGEQPVVDTIPEMKDSSMNEPAVLTSDPEFSVFDFTGGIHGEQNKMPEADAQESCQEKRVAEKESESSRPVSPTTKDAIEESDEGMKKNEKKTLPWCLLATILLAGVLIGGGAIGLFLSRKHALWESQFLADKAKNVSDSSSPEDANTVSSTDASSMAASQSAQKEAHSSLKPNLTLPEADPISGKILPVVESHASPGRQQEEQQPEKQEALPDNVEYVISGTLDSYTLKRGESLVQVALHYYGNKNLWPYIVRHNRSTVKNPDNVPIGTVIQVPKLTPRVDKK